MITKNIVPVVLAGGSGTRLWPLSREQYPKQFLTLEGPHSMLQTTVERLRGMELGMPIVVCNENHRFLVAEHLRQIETLDRNIILEPIGRNTAPAVALAALHALEKGHDPLLLVLSADHIIRDIRALHRGINTAIPIASKGQLVTFGIVPTKPEIGYGYIKQGDPVTAGAYRVSKFVEKPTLDTANAYLEEGHYLWNSGIFMFQASQFLTELKKFRPDIFDACKASMLNKQIDLDFIRIDKNPFTSCPSDSIDYSVMENTTNATVIPISAGWSDVGTFAALWDTLPNDKQGNTLLGDVIAHDSHNNLIISENVLLAAVGIDDMVVIQTKDAILVTPRERSHEVKQIVSRLKSEGRTEHQIHRQVYRPWGHYDSIDSGKRYQVKRITVLPGAKLSVQLHHHRAEHWVVVSGTAHVTLDEKKHLLTENQSIYLPVGSIHSLENPGKIPLELIEVQVGSYLGEDDIVRLEDRYGRANS